MQHPNHPGLIKHTALLTGIVAGIALTFSERAAADDDWYIRAAGGISWIDDDDSADVTDPAGTQNADGSFDTGYTVSLAVGRWFNRNWRADLEWAYRSNDNDEVMLDDGTGIAVKDADRLKRRGRRGRDSDGFGLGLAIVDQLCERLGWRLEIDNRHSGGCRARIANLSA